MIWDATLSAPLQAVNIRRLPARQTSAEGAAGDTPLTSRAVLCGNMCYTSALKPAIMRQLSEQPLDAELEGEYEAQARDVSEGEGRAG
jgi:hypothetical protein